MKRLYAFAAAVACSLSLNAVEWSGIDDSNCITGPKLKPEDLKGKVVMVERWSPGCGPCMKMLPHVEEIWQKYKDRNFVLIGCEVWNYPEDRIKAVVKEKGLTYSIYRNVALASGDPTAKYIPFAFVVDSKGEVVYSGHPGGADLVSALERAIEEAGAPPSPRLYGDVNINPRLKSLASQLVVGKAINSAVRKLEAAEKGRDPELAANAKEVLEAIENSREAHNRYVKYIKDKDPAQALALIGKMKKTWPADAAAYKDEIPALTKAAKEAKSKGSK